MEKNSNEGQVVSPPDDPTKIIRFGVIFLVIVFGLIGGWIAYAPLASSSVAPGKVVVGGVKRKVQHLDGGKVAFIYIKDGDRIKKGDVLIKLDDIQIKEILSNLQVQYQNAIAKYARLKAELEEKESINFPENITEEIKKDQKSIFQTRKKSLKDEELISKKRVVQTKNQINSLEALIDTNNMRLKDISKQIAEQEILFREKLIDKSKIQELRREANRLKGDNESKRADIARLKEKINEIKAQELLSRKKFKEDVLEKLVRTQAAIEDLKTKIETTKERLKRTVIKAPIGGVVVGLKVNTVGDVIKPGEDILEIVPNDYEPLIVAYVQLQDIDKVKVGEQTKITFPAFDMKNMQPIEGKVIYVSADSMENKNIRGSFYQAKIALTDEGKKQLEDHNLTLVAGMPAVAMINTGERTALEYFIKPFKDMIRKSFNEE